MSTSPSWFDQDKFSRLVKKVGPKIPAAQPAAGQAVSLKTPSIPLVKEAQVSPEPTVEEKPRTSILPPQAQLPPEEEVTEPTPAAEESIPVPTPRAPVTEPPREARLSSRLPKIDLRKPGMGVPPIPPPLHSDAGAPVEEKSVEKEDDDIPVLPGAVNRPPISAQKMMTSQPLSIGKRDIGAPPLPNKTEEKAEPIRAPEVPSLPTSNVPPLAGGSTSGKLPQRTTSLPALKSLFQFEIPGRSKAVSGKPDAEIPEPKSPLPAFSFPKAEKKITETLPPVLDDEEDIPSFAGQSDAAALDEIETELTPENLAAEWGKADGLKTDLERITMERDDAVAESEALLKQLREVRESSSAEKPADTAELDFLTKERDEVRGEYIKLREDFEKLKQELQGKPAPAKVEANPELEKEIEQLRHELAEKDNEVRGLKLQVNDAPSPEADPELENELEALREKLADKDRELSSLKNTSTGMSDVVETLKEELNTLKADLKKTKDDASVAQRGLALSQKALQETRDALREASENAAKK